MSRGATLAVLGAAGTIARAIVRDLAESPQVEELLLLDRDGEGAERVAREHGGQRARARAIDVRGGGLARELAGVRVLVNSASYRLNLDVMQAALAAGCHYIDLGGLYWMTRRQLDLHERFADAGLLALLGMGASPGKTNVMARRAVSDLAGEPVQRIDVCAAGRDPLAAERNDGRLHPPYALQTLLDELTMRPVVLEHGEPRELEPMTAGGTVLFPPPIGAAETIHTLHSELATFAASFGCTEASFRLSLAPALLEELHRLAHAADAEVARAAANAAAPSDSTLAAHVVTASSATRQVRVHALTRAMPEWGLGGGIVSTAAPAAAAARMLLDGRLTARGALAPEACVSPEALFPELERRGCHFTVEQTEVADDGEPSAEQETRAPAASGAGAAASARGAAS